MARQPWTRLVTRDEDRQDAIERVASEQYWILDEVVQRSAERPFEMVWITEDEEVSIHFVDDFVLGLPYVLVRGEHKDEVVALLHDELDTVDRAEVLDRGLAAKSDDDLVMAVYLVAASASSSFDPELFEVVARAASADAPPARAAAAVALGYVEWPEGEEVLERLAADEAPEVAEVAAGVLAGLRQLWTS